MISICRNLRIDDNIDCGPGHGNSIGSLGHYDSEGRCFRDHCEELLLYRYRQWCKNQNIQNDSPSRAAGIIFEDLRGSSKHSKVSIEDVKFSNIQEEHLCSKVAVDLICSKASPCKGISLKIDLHFVGTGGASIPFSSNCTNVKVFYPASRTPRPAPLTASA
ncbi:hypothetical protein GQ457_13G000090 [Hibiscus cannabinus]